jgi:hypothetical protein
MKIPEFTAEASLHRTSNNYRSAALYRASPKRTAVIPQLGGPGFKGFAGCQNDCLDQHPELTRDQCARRCRDPFAGVDLSTPRNSFNDFLSSAGIDFWEGGCSALVNPWLCRQVADEIRRQS